MKVDGLRFIKLQTITVIDFVKSALEFADPQNAICLGSPYAVNHSWHL